MSVPVATAGMEGGIFVSMPPPLPNPTRPLMSTVALPYLAYIYTNSWGFIRTLSVLDVPSISQKINSGFDPITLTLPQSPTAYTPAISLGNILLLIEEGGDGSVLFGGVIETLPENLSSLQTNFQVIVNPFVMELGDTSFNQNYTTPTDVATIVHDAINKCLHVNGNFYTMVPMTGVQVIIQFNNTTVLDVIEQCRIMAGSTYWWFVDAVGRMWFQPMGSAATPLLQTQNGPSQAFHSITASSIEELDVTKSIQNLKNDILIVGGLAPFASVPTTAEYGPGINANTSSTITQYGTRFFNPPIALPGIYDQATITQIANQLGALLDRVQTTVDMQLPNYGNRIVFGQQGGPIVRYFIPASWPNQETPSAQTTGGFSVSYIALSSQTDSLRQHIQVGDLPYNSSQDADWEIVRILQRSSINSAIYTPNSLNTQTTYGTQGTTVVQDANGIQRLQWGNLLSYTDPNGVTSPAEEGIRVLDASGNIIFDTVGISQVMSLLSSNTAANGSFGSGASNPTWRDIITTNYTLARKSTVMVMAICGAAGDDSVSEIITSNNQLQLLGDGVTASAPGNAQNAYNNIPLCNVTLLQVLTLAAGSYTAHFQYQTYNLGRTTITYYYFSPSIFVFSMGS